MHDSERRDIAGKKTAERSTVDSDALLRGHQIHAMESNVPKSLLGYLIIIAISAYPLRSEWGALFAIWGPVVAVICIARSYLAWRTARRPVEPMPRSTEWRLMVATALVSAAMAVGPTWVVLNSDGYTRIFMLMVIVSTMWGGALVQATVLTSTVAFTAANIPVWIVALFLSGANAGDLGLAAIFFVTIGIAIDNTRRYDNYFSQSVRRQIELEKWDGKARLLRMIDDMPVAVMTVEPDTLIINYANETSKALIRAIEHLLPIAADKLVGSSIDVFHRHPEHQRRLLADPNNLPHNARIRLGPEVLDLKITAVTDDDGSYIGPMLSWALVTKEVEAEDRIRQLAHYDTLTGLANRANFRDKLEAALAVNRTALGLLFIDLDGFKLVNDTKGHRIGDELLMQVADRLRDVCSTKGMTIGRLGGDEFSVFVPDASTATLEDLATRIIEALSVVFTLEQGHQVQIGASIGIAIAPIHANGSETLLARADIALYAAKNAGKGTFKMFSDDMESRIQERAHLQAGLRAALQDNEGLFVFYQPIVDARTKKVTAREALVRWHHPQRGWISPAEFVPIAEQSGLIDQLGEFVLNTACREAAGWEDSARVAVNVSAAQLGKGTIGPAVLAALTGSGLSPDRLEIEVTETAMLSDEHGSIGDLRRIRDMGVRLALDDFGTGYSSLTHLRAFPFDKIKIDGSFVKDAVERPEAAAVVKAIADLGNRLGVTTVAEGVETEAHLIRVLEEGCSEVQGYFYSRPMPSERDAARIEELNKSAATMTAA